MSPFIVCHWASVSGKKIHAARGHFKVSVTNYIERVEVRLTILSVVQASWFSRLFFHLHGVSGPLCHDLTIDRDKKCRGRMMTYPWTVDRSSPFMVHLGKPNDKQ